VQQATPATGLGPLYNATSCVDCHQNPVTGGSSQVSEMRAGHMVRGVFVNPEGGNSLIHDRATSREIQQRIPATEDIRAFRMSTSILGLGYVEAVDDQTLLSLAQAQAAQTGGRVHGQAIMVPILEAPGVSRVGRFGWKDEHASLLSFSADADVNEKGITSRLLPDEDLYFGRSVDAFNQDTTEPMIRRTTSTCTRVTCARPKSTSPWRDHARCASRRSHIPQDWLRSLLHEHAANRCRRHKPERQHTYRSARIGRQDDSSL